MGLFDKFSKKNKKDESAAELAEKTSKLVAEKAKTEVQDEKVQENSAEPDTKKGTESSVDVADTSKDQVSVVMENRFTLVVEEAFEMKDDMGIVVGGNAHGKIKIHDKLYLVHPILPKSITVEISAIEAGPMNMVDEAENCRVGLRIDSLKKRDEVPRFSVLTNIAPQITEDPSKPLENPYLFGLTYEHERFVNDAAYFRIITFAIFSSRFLTPIKLDNEPEKTGDGKAVVTAQTKIGFKLLKHPGNPELKVLPVFTDWAALKRWDKAFDGEEKPKTLLMPFEQCADIGLKNGGFVINPVGPAPVYVANENIKKIAEMKANLDKKIDEERKKAQENG